MIWVIALLALIAVLLWSLGNTLATGLQTTNTLRKSMQASLDNIEAHTANLERD